MRCLVSCEVDCQLTAVVATGNQQAHERSLGLISVAPAQERPRASLAEEARRAVQVRRRGTGHSRRRQTNGPAESAAGGRRQSFRTQHTIIAQVRARENAQRARETTRTVRARFRLAPCVTCDRQRTRLDCAPIGGEEVGRARPTFDTLERGCRNVPYR